MEVDLSEQLKRRKIDLASKIDRSIGVVSDKAEKIKPFQADSRRWQRGGRFSTRVKILPETQECVVSPSRVYRICKSHSTFQCTSDKFLAYCGSCFMQSRLFFPLPGYV